MTVLIHNGDTHRMERYERTLRDPMPYSDPNADVALLVGEFRGSSKSELMRCSIIRRAMA